MKSLRAIICIVVVLWSRFSSPWKGVGLSKMNWKWLASTSEGKARKEHIVSAWFSVLLWKEILTLGMQVLCCEEAQVTWRGHVQVFKQTAPAEDTASSQHPSPNRGKQKTSVLTLRDSSCTGDPDGGLHCWAQSTIRAAKDSKNEYHCSSTPLNLCCIAKQLEITGTVGYLNFY